ncbi:TPA: excinuclease ABC subunit B [Candidatus Collierbacteria bacterium]|uniref:UvrABC system protein B n=1 Tax=Candidatus Collierbacteria bacterium GW2011_GWB2_44_22 TaxID=1618387 RepID=A0A0G1HY24_9BACT|nr:MAG: UvrABC system protein B [Candidatus Collierbacteria bacterium GW2011_GWA2_44_13]KKT51508.1 MAG: UvrABC system protein B [Candidatus Collierbacteria bacterium GW2011_GWB2_44_22]KKT62245.1 MAG: UvrABC system protein B [Candidatus Collierbacteria bacterium GW2011_GWD1_44_27]KKT66786.1 MAG: UvrABC system protein B [Candidatus Collierbacteria bacterium GW2011_GWC2_44_30]KKT69050.1 MAG: excinuclease ABC, B subunit, excinuclease ABC subunit B [Microgenomates group bacterium GW2011_GWC1_44_37]
MEFKLESTYRPTGDQPKAIEKLAISIDQQNPHQTLVGVTGSGKTFTIANVIQKTQLPTLVMCHNKTLASQLYQEFRDFFPHNAVSYFVSYYDYYQPEAYIPQTDTYIEKEADINPEIDKFRLTTTANLLSRPDSIVVASVSCIYNIGSPLDQEINLLPLARGQVISRDTVLMRLSDLQYTRTNSELTRGMYRAVGSTVQLFPSYKDIVISMVFEGNTLSDIEILDPMNYTKMQDDDLENTGFLTIHPAKLFITNPKTQGDAIANIRKDLETQVKAFKDAGKIIEAHRLEQKVNYDLSMLEEVGYVSGIENYSRYFDGRVPGSAPFSLLEYFHYNAKKFNKPGFLTVIDESHISLPQVRGMYNGDQARKDNLINFGFRLPSAKDNRPLTYTEWQSRTPIKLYCSATPTDHELSLSRGSKIPTVAEQLIRPTGLLDPQIQVFPAKGQIDHLTQEVIKRTVKGERTLILTMTKRMAEDLSDHLKEKYQLKVEYLHSDIHTMDRADILDKLRLGDFDCLVGINLLREGLDLPEVSLVAILDADKEGFLRTSTALIQTMGRAARHVNGEVYLYADRISDSMKIAMDETLRRRKIQMDYNTKHDIIPQGISKPIRDRLFKAESQTPAPRIKELAEHGWTEIDDINPEALTPQKKKILVVKLKKMMNQAANSWNFELAARYRDTIKKLS